MIDILGMLRDHRVTIMTWRWDQGRLQYFQYDEIRKIAATLVQIEGTETSMRAGDLLRLPLEQTTGLDFLPRTYSVWRNYGRVFELQLLAVQAKGRLKCTNLCRLLARDQDAITGDEYLSILARTFYY